MVACLLACKSKPLDGTPKFWQQVGAVRTVQHSKLTTSTVWHAVSEFNQAWNTSTIQSDQINFPHKFSNYCVRPLIKRSKLLLSHSFKIQLLWLPKGGLQTIRLKMTLVNFLACLHWSHNNNISHMSMNTEYTVLPRKQGLTVILIDDGGCANSGNGNDQQCEVKKEV